MKNKLIVYLFMEPKIVIRILKVVIILIIQWDKSKNSCFNNQYSRVVLVILVVGIE